MSPWQKRARIGVATFGLAVAAIVYFAMRERETPAPPAPVERIDPKAVIEQIGCDIERVIRSEKNFNVECETFRIYEDGSTKFTALTITVPKGENRTFKVSAKEGSTGKDESELGLIGDVRLEDSDGFYLTTQRGTYKQKDAIAHAPGSVDFGKGRMKGSGVGISYDQGHDLLVISSYADITTTDEAGNPTMELTAGSGTLDRVQHVLTLETNVRIMRGGQIIEADFVKARLSENDDIITFISLRGNARVEGGGSSIDAMSARDINLDYTDDGTRLEVVELNGTAAVAMKGEKGGGDRQIVADLIGLNLAADGSSHMVLTNNANIVMAGEAGRTGRTIAGDMLEVDLAADGSLTRVVGRENVRLDLPNAPGAPVRSITTQQLDGRGVAGKGLTAATFTGNVIYTEQAGKTSARRTARAQKLEAAMAGDAVNVATFTGDVTFEETGLKACAGRLEYQPEKGTLKLSEATPAGVPTVAEEQVNIEAQTIEVALQGQNRHIVAKGNMTTRMGSGTRCKPSTERPTAQRGASRLPGLLNPDAAITINAATLDYQGATGKAVYTGLAGRKASISQGDTLTIQADAIAIDQTTGDLTATGSAIATMALDDDSSSGTAHEIRYVETTRTITYSAPPVGYVAPAAAPGATVYLEPRLILPRQTNLTAGRRIVVTLAKDEAKAERIEAHTNVTMAQGIGQSSKRASGGSTLVYQPDLKQFVMNASGTTLVTFVDRSGATCRALTGRSLTFFETGDTIEIDGRQTNRTQAAPIACPATR